ncbi:MAG: hypothetical protein ABI452_03505 [Candidatus Limnocylindrales bacterium]
MTSYASGATRGAASTSSSMVTALRTGLVWPIISLLITGMWHFTIEAIWPELRSTFVPAVLGPILLSYGAWAGYRTALAGGGYVGAIVAGAILGLLPLMLDIVGFGVILGRGTDVGVLAGVFGFSMVLFGGLLGGGFANVRSQG